MRSNQFPEHSSPTSYSHADFLRAAALEGAEIGGLSRRSEPEIDSADSLLIMAKQSVENNPDLEVLDPQLQEALMGLRLERFSTFSTATSIADSRVAGAWRQVEPIIETFGATLTSRQLELFWKNSAEEWLSQFNLNEPEMNLNCLPFSLLLATAMTDRDSVTLEIPSDFDAKLALLGACLNRGALTIEGSLGVCAAFRAGGDAIITIIGDCGNAAAVEVKDRAAVVIDGNAGYNVAQSATGFASIKVVGNVGKDAGYLMGGNSHLIVGGDADMSVGHLAGGQAQIEVHGNAGVDAGLNIKGEATLRVHGDAGAFFGTSARDRATLELDGTAESIGTVYPSYRGVMKVGGQEVELPR